MILNILRNRFCYPFLFAIFPGLFLYAHNISETRFVVTLPALIFSLLFSILLWRGVGLVFADRAKAGMVTLIGLSLFFSYGRIYEPLNYFFLGLGFGFSPHFIMISLFIVIWSAMARMIYRSQRDFAATIPILNVMAGSLVLINLFSILLFGLKSNPASLEVKKDGITAAWNVRTRPDVYYIVLDEYANPDDLRELYGFDNSEFVSNLRRKGFFIAENSRTRYSLSENCMASVLNMRFLDNKDEPMELIQNSLVAKLFGQLGYAIYIYPLSYKAIFNNSTKVIGYADSWLNDFNLLFLRSTMLNWLADSIIEKKDYGQYFRAKTLFSFAQLSHMADIRGPKFVYFHIMCPHAPFIFDRNGGPVEPRDFFNLREHKYYLDQYIYVSKKIAELVERLQNSAVPSVIVIQSDHGQRAKIMGRSQPELGKFWAHIFSAFFLPHGDNKELTREISPVNTFRVIFNAYFGAGLPLLPD